MEPPSAECLVQLLGRTKRPSLAKKNDVLFDSGPRSKEVIELTGSSGSASHRTHICLDLMAKYLLPVSFGEIHVGGHECGIVLLDADQHIDLFKLVLFMEARVTRCLSEAGAEVVQKIIRTALGRLAIIQVFNHADLTAALQTAKNHIFHHQEVSLVVLDSISSAYWTNVAAGGIRQINRYVDDILKTVHKYLGSFDICFLYTRTSDFFSKSIPPHQDLSADCDLKNVNTRISIQPNGRVDIHRSSQMRIVFFEATRDGVKFSSG